MEAIGRRFYRLRKKIALTQKEVALRIGVSPSTYRDWEYGKQIKGEPYLSLAEIFKVNITYLLSGEGPPQNELFHQIRELERIVEMIRKSAASI